MTKGGGAGHDHPEAPEAPSRTILRFEYGPQGLGVSRHGSIRRGGRLVIEYDPRRLQPGGGAFVGDDEILCHLSFHPGGQRYSASALRSRGAPLGAAETPRPAPIEVLVPADARRVEMWFERRGPTGRIGWDNRYGQNYVFDVPDGGLPVPERSVESRADALVDPGRIRVVADAARKEGVAPGAAGRHLQTHLVIRALVPGASVVPDVWADVHVFDAVGTVIHSGSVPLQARETTADGALFVWEDKIYEGSGGGSGMGVWLRPDAHVVQYRLYGAMDQHVFTDGVLHEFEVPADEEARASSG